MALGGGGLQALLAQLASLESKKEAAPEEPQSEFVPVEHWRQWYGQHLWQLPRWTYMCKIKVPPEFEPTPVMKTMENVSLLRLREGAALAVFFSRLAKAEEKDQEEEGDDVEEDGQRDVGLAIAIAGMISFTPIPGVQLNPQPPALGNFRLSSGYSELVADFPDKFEDHKLFPEEELDLLPIPNDDDDEDIADSAKPKRGAEDDDDEWDSATSSSDEDTAEKQKAPTRAGQSLEILQKTRNRFPDISGGVTLSMLNRLFVDPGNAKRPTFGDFRGDFSKCCGILGNYELFCRGLGASFSLPTEIFSFIEGATLSDHVSVVEALLMHPPKGDPSKKRKNASQPAANDSEGSDEDEEDGIPSAEDSSAVDNDDDDFPLFRELQDCLNMSRATKPLVLQGGRSPLIYIGARINSMCPPSNDEALLSEQVELEWSRYLAQLERTHAKKLASAKEEETAEGVAAASTTTSGDTHHHHRSILEAAEEVDSQLREQALKKIPKHNMSKVHTWFVDAILANRTFPAFDYQSFNFNKEDCQYMLGLYAQRIRGTGHSPPLGGRTYTRVELGVAQVEMTPDTSYPWTALMCGMGRNEEVTINLGPKAQFQKQKFNRVEAGKKALTLKIEHGGLRADTSANWNNVAYYMSPKQTITVEGKEYNRVECAKKSLDVSLLEMKQPLKASSSAWDTLATLMGPTDSPYMYEGKPYDGIDSIILGLRFMYRHPIFWYHLGLLLWRKELFERDGINWLDEEEEEDDGKTTTRDDVRSPGPLSQASVAKFGKKSTITTLLPSDVASTSLSLLTEAMTLSGMDPSHIEMRDDGAVVVNEEVCYRVAMLLDERKLFGEVAKDDPGNIPRLVMVLGPEKVSTKGRRSIETAMENFGSFERKFSSTSSSL